MASNYECKAPHKFSNTSDFNAPALAIEYSIELADDELGKEILSFLKKNGEKRLKKVVAKQISDIQTAIDEAQVLADDLKATAKAKPNSNAGPEALKKHVTLVADASGRLEKMLAIAPKLLKQGVEVLSNQVNSECESIKKDALASVSKARKAAAKKLKLKGTGNAVLKGSFYATAGLIALAATVATGGTGLGLAFGVLAASTSAINSANTVWNTVNSNLKSESKVITQAQSVFDEILALSKKLAKLQSELQTHQKVRLAKAAEAEAIVANLTRQAASVGPEHADIKKAILNGAEPMKAACADLKSQSKLTDDAIKICGDVISFNEGVGKKSGALRTAAASAWGAADKVIGVGKSMNIVISKLDNFKANFSSMASPLKKLGQLGKALGKLK